MTLRVLLITVLLHFVHAGKTEKVPPVGKKPSRRSRREKKVTNTQKDKVIEEQEDKLIEEVLTADLEAEKTDIAVKWETHMKGYRSDLMVTFDLPASQEEVFCTEVNETTLIRGAWLATTIAGEKATPVDIRIVDPDEVEIFTWKYEESGVFAFESNAIGLYKFFIRNSQWGFGKTQRVTYTMGTGMDVILEEEHLEPAQERVKSIRSMLDDIRTESTYLWIRTKSSMQQGEVISSRTYWFSALKLVCLIAVSAFQVFYIKSLLNDDDRRYQLRFSEDEF